MLVALLSSLPFAIDDPPKCTKSSGTDISDLIVDLFNGCKTANLKAGSLLPLSTAIVATNFDLRNEERYVNFATTVFPCLYNMFPAYRSQVQVPLRQLSFFV